MKLRILKKFVKAYRPYGNDREGYRLGMKEESKARYWHKGHLRWWTHERHKQKKLARKYPRNIIWGIELT